MKTRFGGIGHQAALAPAALLGRAGLVVDDGGDAGDLAHLALDRVQLVAMMDDDAVGKVDVADTSPARR